MSKALSHVDEHEGYAAAHATYKRAREALNSARQELEDHAAQTPKETNVEAKAAEFNSGADLEVHTASETRAGHAARGEEIQLRIRTLESALRQAENTRRVALREACTAILAQTKGEWGAIVAEATGHFEALLKIEDKAEAYIDRLREMGVFHQPAPRPYTAASTTLIFAQNTKDAWASFVRTAHE